MNITTEKKKGEAVKVFFKQLYLKRYRYNYKEKKESIVKNRRGGCTQTNEHLSPCFFCLKYSPDKKPKLK